MPQCASGELFSGFHYMIGSKLPLMCDLTPPPVSGAFSLCGSIRAHSTSLNSHYFHIIGDGHQPNSGGLYIHYKDSRHSRWTTIPQRLLTLAHIPPGTELPAGELQVGQVGTMECPFAQFKHFSKIPFLKP